MYLVPRYVPGMQLYSSTTVPYHMIILIMILTRYYRTKFSTAAHLPAGGNGSDNVGQLPLASRTICIRGATLVFDFHSVSVCTGYRMVRVLVPRRVPARVGTAPDLFFVQNIWLTQRAWLTGTMPHVAKGIHTIVAWL